MAPEAAAAARDVRRKCLTPRPVVASCWESVLHPKGSPSAGGGAAPGRRGSPRDRAGLYLRARLRCCCGDPAPRSVPGGVGTVPRGPFPAYLWDRIPGLLEESNNRESCALFLRTSLFQG